MNTPPLATFDLKSEIYCLSVRYKNPDPGSSSKMVAVGTKNSVKLMKMNVKPGVNRAQEELSTTISRDGHITDVAWNPNTDCNFLACHSKGIIKYFTVNNTSLSSTWSLQHDDNEMLKVSWNSMDQYVFGVAIRNSNGKLYDIRKPSYINLIPGKNLRDIAFHPSKTQSELLISDIDNNVKIFDIRKFSQSLFDVMAFDKSHTWVKVNWLRRQSSSSSSSSSYLNGFITNSGNAIKIWEEKNDYKQSDNNNNTMNNNHIDQHTKASATITTATTNSNISYSSQLISLAGQVKSVVCMDNMMAALTVMVMSSHISSNYRVTIIDIILYLYYIYF
jgi:hypothetical protein